MKLSAKSRSFASIRWMSLLALMGIGCAANLQGQDGFGEGADLFPNFSLGGFGEDSDEPASWSASYTVDAEGKGQIEVAAELSPTWHIYSTTQPAGGPTRTKLSVTGPESVKATGEFVPSEPPHKSVSSVYDGLTVEEHEGNVVWSAPIQTPAGFSGPIKVKLNGLVCKSGGDNRCMPVQEELTAKLSGSKSASADVLTSEDANVKAVGKPFRDGDYVVEWTAVVTPKQLAPGQSGVLTFTAKPDPTFHVYKTAIDDAESSTNFVVTKKAGVLVGEPVTDKPVVTKTILPSLPPISYFKGQVTWQLPFKVPADAAAGKKQIEGMIAYQACTDNSCHRPTALKFTADIDVGDTVNEPAPIQLVSAKSAAALDAAATTKWVDPIKLQAATQPTEADVSTSVEPDSTVASTEGDREDEDAAVPVAGTPPTSFPIILGFAFLGGLILNVMPCVLPVVGLKIMGFVSQAGEDRRRILTLNFVYVLGIMSVFAIFAGVAAVSKFGWGEQFTYFPVRLGLTLVLFALALSYLGVWEIPVPGMAAGKASQDLQSREGLLGAFSKGVFATVLATPCSGPLLGYILGLTLDLSPAHTIAIFLTVGLGMSLPYIVIGFQPKLIAWLPKPGPWMETLKQLMAFLFLGTVAFFFAQFNDTQKVPVFVSLIAVWFGCWIIGQVPNWAELQKRILAWIGGIAAATLISVWAFNYLKPDHELAWEDYSEPRLQQLQNEGKTVLVDFGAKWCGTCIYNYEVAINTPTTREVVDELDAVAMYADWTDYNQEIKTKLEELNSRSIPLLAIYPGNRPGKPIILRDLVTQDAVVNALREAGASLPASAVKLGRATDTFVSTTR
ncbi:MAG: protein-disulfide reductase DsbD domain-containing protein [Rubripirellula sp.]